MTFTKSGKPRFGSSWDEYRNSIEDRWSGVTWGYEVTGQFESQEEINNYPVNIDGLGNKSLLPGDLIYKDVNGDGLIDQYDERPIGYSTVTWPPSAIAQPLLNIGFVNTFNWKNFDLSINLLK